MASEDYDNQQSFASETYGDNEAIVNHFREDLSNGSEETRCKVENRRLFEYYRDSSIRDEASRISCSSENNDENYSRSSERFHDNQNCEN